MEEKNPFKIVASKKSRFILPNLLTLIGVCLGISSIKFALDANTRSHLKKSFPVCKDWTTAGLQNPDCLDFNNFRNFGSLNTETSYVKDLLAIENSV